MTVLGPCCSEVHLPNVIHSAITGSGVVKKACEKRLGVKAVTTWLKRQVVHKQHPLSPTVQRFCCTTKTKISYTAYRQ